MIDPHNWQGFITLKNMEEVAEALRTRLASRFDIVQWFSFTKDVCLVQRPDAIRAWKHEIDENGGIIIAHDYGEDYGHGNFAMETDVTYLRFTEDAIFVQNKGEHEKYYTYIPRKETQ
jgi:hypothetical protein